MRGTIKRIERTGGTAILHVVDEFGDGSLVHVDGGPLFHAIVGRQLREGDVIEYTTVEIGTMPMVAVIAETKPA